MKKKMRKVDTSRGYISKPKARAGYKIDSYYCECGCKRGYWCYVKLKAKKFKPTAKLKQARVKSSLPYKKCDSCGTEYYSNGRCPECLPMG